MAGLGWVIIAFSMMAVRFGGIVWGLTVLVIAHTGNKQLKSARLFFGVILITINAAILCSGFPITNFELICMIVVYLVFGTLFAFFLKDDKTDRIIGYFSFMFSVPPIIVLAATYGQGV